MKLFIALIAGLIALRRPFASTQERKPRRGDAYYLQVRKEIGIDPYSPAELVQMAAEERQVQERNAVDGAFWSGNDNYVEWR
jgi:hypothetical protein